MKSLFCASAAFLLLVAAAGPASADRGDRIDERLERRERWRERAGTH